MLEQELVTREAKAAFKERGSEEGGEGGTGYTVLTITLHAKLGKVR